MDIVDNTAVLLGNIEGAIAGWSVLANSTALDAGVEGIYGEVASCVSKLEQYVAVAKSNLSQVLSYGDIARLKVFSILNEMLLGNERFRKSTTKVLKSHEVSKEPAGIIVRIVELIADFLTLTRASRLLVHEEYNHSVVLLKFTRLVNLQEVSHSSVDLYDEFSGCGDHLMNGIENSHAGNGGSEKMRQRYDDEQTRLRVLRLGIRLIVSSIQESMSTTHDFHEQSLKRAKAWAAVLDEGEYGFGVESYVERCTRDLALLQELGHVYERIIEKAIVAERSFAAIGRELAEVSHLGLPKDPELLMRLHTLESETTNFVDVTVQALFFAWTETYEKVIGSGNIAAFAVLQEQWTEEIDVPAAKKHHKHKLFGVLSRSIPSETCKQKLKRHTHSDIVNEFELSYDQTVAILSLLRKIAAEPR